MTARPDVSIVVCTFNRMTSLRKTLASLVAQRTPAGFAWELVVVDNNSEDATRAVIAHFAATATLPIRSLFVAKQGLSHARNAGIAQSLGAIIGFTDDDVDPAPDWVARMHASVSATGADVLGGRILPAWLESPPAWLERRSFHGLLTIMDHPITAEIVNAHSVPSVWGANMAFRREVFDKVGVFDTRRGLQGRRRYGGEDTELVGRALAAGYRVAYDPELVVRHRIGRERMRLRYLSRVCFERAEGAVRVRPRVRRPSFLGVPLGMYWATAKHAGRWLGAVALRRPDRIQRWLDCCGAAGSLWGACASRFTPCEPRREDGG